MLNLESSLNQNINSMGEKRIEADLNPAFRKKVENSALELVNQGLNQGKVDILLGKLGLFIDNKPLHVFFEFQFDEIESLKGKKVYVGSNEE